MYSPFEIRLTVRVLDSYQLQDALDKLRPIASSFFPESSLQYRGDGREDLPWEEA